MKVEYKLKDIDKAAQEIWEQGKAYKTWAFHGQMGNGKTTLIHALCGLLEVKDAVSSPTFAIINEYLSPAAGIIYHMDWYRIKDEEEAIQAGIEDSLQTNAYCFIEWPEKAAALLPDDTLHLYIEWIDEGTRQVNSA